MSEQFDTWANQMGGRFNGFGQYKGGDLCGNTDFALAKHVWQVAWRAATADLEQQLVELTASYQRALAQREELYRQLNPEGKTQTCPECKRSLQLDMFDRSERPTRLGTKYVCRACLEKRVPPCAAHGGE